MFQIECLVNVVYTLNAYVLHSCYFCTPLLLSRRVFSVRMTLTGTPDLQTIDLHTAKHTAKY